MCDDTAPGLRDGTPTDQVDAATKTIPDDVDQSKSVRATFSSVCALSSFVLGVCCFLSLVVHNIRTHARTHMHTHAHTCTHMHTHAHTTHATHTTHRATLGSRRPSTIIR